MARYALLTKDLSAIQIYPLTREMVMRREAVGSLAVMISRKTDITKISPRIVRLQATPRPPESETYTITSGVPVKQDEVWVEVWETTPRTPEETEQFLNREKKAKFAEVRKKGADLRSGKFTIGQGQFDLSGDGFARIVLMAAIPGPRTIPIGPAENGVERYLAATGQQIDTLVTAVSTFIDETYANESTLRDLIEQAATLQEVRQIDINQGWPGAS